MALGEIDPATSLEYRALLTLSPFLPSVLRTELEGLRDELEDWDAASVPITKGGPWMAHLHDGWHPVLRLYLLGLLNEALGDLVAARRYAEQLEDTALPEGPESGYLPFVQIDFAYSIRSAIAPRCGKTATRTSVPSSRLPRPGSMSCAGSDPNAT